MASLSNKSAEEIGELLDEYGIKHGPVVESTRRLYEKKLKEAMAKETKAKPSSDKTYYREEEEEVTYVYRTPNFTFLTRNEGSGDRGTYMRSRPDWTGGEYGHETSYLDYIQSRPEYGGRDFAEQPAMYDTPSSYRNSSLKAAPVKSGQKAQGAAKSTRLVPLWLQFFFFLAVAVFLYFVFSNMETNESIKGLD